MSIDELVGEDGDLAVERLFPSPEVDAATLAAKRQVATTEPIFAWRLARPDGQAVTIRLTLEPKAADSDVERQRFLSAARKVVAAHQRGAQTIVLSGVPVIRARFAEMLGADVARFFPLALAVVLVILALSYRSLGAVLAGLVTIVAAVVWAHGLMGILGYPITLLSSILPVVIVIISLSDTVHIVNDFFARRRRGEARGAALLDAMAHAAGPCLATEVVIACGFLSLVAVNIVGIAQFGAIAAGAMLLTWLANMTVLPLALSLARGGAALPIDAPASATRPPRLVAVFARIVDWIGQQGVRRPGRVIAVYAAILVAGGLAASRVEKLSYAFDDLRPESSFARELRFAEATHGGLVPVAIYVESLAPPDAENPMLEPEVVRLLDRASAFLRSFPEIQQATSVADYLRKANRILLPEEDRAPDGLPGTRALAAQEVEVIDESGMLRDHLSFDRRAAAALGFAADAGSRRVAAMFERIDAWVAAEQARLDGVPGGPRARIHATGQLRIFRDVNASLIDGLIGSFGGAVLVTILVFCVVLRSWRLGLIGLIPNLTPMILTVGFMAVCGITLRPTTVILFSIVLVIADDDTIQYLARLRAVYARLRQQGIQEQDLHQATALVALRESGLPMFVTSTAVAAGFLLLTLSSLEGTADLGLLIGVTLFFAVFADMFLAPILITRLKPPLAERPRQTP
jgi:predicted RND superfamily exporter protein